MKKLLIVLLALVLALSCTACSEKEVDLTAVKAAIDGGNLFIDEFVQLSDARIESVIGLDISQCESAAFYIGSGNTGEEYGLFTCVSKDAATALVAQLEARRDSNYALYATYAVDALPRISNTVIRQVGRYVIYVAADKYDEAATVVDNALK